MFVETSAPRKENDTAVILSPIYTTKNTSMCVTFYTHMYGSHIGTLNLYAKEQSKCLSADRASAGGRGGRRGKAREGAGGRGGRRGCVFIVSINFSH